MGDHPNRAMSKVVFVGNVPYDVEEVSWNISFTWVKFEPLYRLQDALIPIFQTVGPIAGFRYASSPFNSLL